MAIQDHAKYTRLMNIIANLITKIGAKQAGYFTAKSKFFQGLKIPVGNCDGDTDVLIDSSLHPPDQEESWNDFDSVTFTTNTKIPVNITLDVYDAPLGWSWVLTIDLWYAGLDPDEYGQTGDHWRYRHYEGTELLGIWDKWQVMDDTIDGSV